nr:ornithine cyclodeaminase [Actinomycetota bacterium]
MADDFLYLSRKEVEFACAELDAVEVVRQALRAHASGGTCLPPESYLEWSAPRVTARSIAMAGFVNGQPGVKLISANPANVDTGLPRASGLTLLLDPDTARVRCVMDAAHISALRTAAVTQLSIELLASPGSELVAVLGAGELARAHVTMMLE